MPTSNKTTFNWGEDYAKFRPTYPDELPGLLAGLVDDTSCALDVGCGTGQLTEMLTDSFDTVVGMDISASQVGAAAGNAAYMVAEASHLPLEEKSINLVTAAQSAHWIDVDEFYAEARRVAAPGAVIALVSYGLCMIDDPEVDRIYQEFYQGEFHKFWDARRVHVETGLRNLPFPFKQIKVECPDIIKTMGVEDFLSYIGTWSASKSAQAQGSGDLLEELGDNLRYMWGSRQLDVRWPVAVRAGRLAQ
ncbi:class I SAM-dependent methyltransferase [Corynebacterium cystitidis]|uniref:class I SAM-dependent methyltransferase n=1 Tax=Corynebacterium cystitidis TaxID=35757 RepID=UPI00211DDC83|nr:class I SAM-dependent methyltransferase [Corynebacterium cystitidis]